jgi:hypothetical protein
MRVNFRLYAKQAQLFSSILLLVLGAIGCNRVPSINQHIVIPNWGNYESLLYGITLNDSVIGTMEYDLIIDMERNESVYILTQVTEVDEEEDILTDSSVVCFRRDDFTPMWAYRKTESDFGYYITDVHYDKSKAQIRFETIDGKESKNISVQFPYFDNEMLLTLLRTIQFDKIKKYSFESVVPMVLVAMNNTVHYRGKANITTPAGKFRCDKITLNSPQNKCNIFYEQNNPRRMIRYQVEKSRIAIILLQSLR